MSYIFNYFFLLQALDFSSLYIIKKKFFLENKRVLYLLKKIPKHYLWFLTLPGLECFKNLRVGGVGAGAVAGLVSLRLKKSCISENFLHFTRSFLLILHWQYGRCLDWKVGKCHFCHHLMTSSWNSYVDVFYVF